MEETKFNIALKAATGLEPKEVSGIIINVFGQDYGMRMPIHGRDYSHLIKNKTHNKMENQNCDNDDYPAFGYQVEITHLETGMLISFGQDEKSAIELLEKRLLRKDIESVIQSAREFIIKEGLKLPLNNYDNQELKILSGTK